jgi:proteasome lid subunit RPN8/RPN11
LAEHREQIPFDAASSRDPEFDDWEPFPDETASRLNPSAACQETIYPHVFVAPEREVGDFLIGREESGSLLPRVSEAIEAVGAVDMRGSPTFTQESWANVVSVTESCVAKESGSDELGLVGWYHSHPNSGVYLSEADLFINQNSFTGARQVALGVDPLRSREGLFVWKEQSMPELSEQDVEGEIPCSHASRDRALESIQLQVSRDVRMSS